ncbi:MAG: RsmE family RNA methyltransferase [Patescibacteria group bacterium]
MKLHRFYVANKFDLKHNFWIHDSALVHQISRVLRLRIGEDIVLFDGQNTDRLYKIKDANPLEVHVELVTEFERKVPKKDIYLLWSLLKKDKNDWVIQKCTELGVSHFIPMLSERTEKIGFDVERAVKITIEAAEQCGRSDIPTVHEPLKLSSALEKFAHSVQLFICEQDSDNPDAKFDSKKPLGAVIGPEGGWSDTEKQLFIDQKLQHLNLHDFTLRAETACVAAVAKLL